MKKISKSSKLQCVFCQGKGVQPGTERLSCIVCGGRGRVTARQPINICNECKGTGKKAGTRLYCLSCHGKGFVEETSAPSIGKRKTGSRRKKSAKKLGRLRIKKTKRTAKKGKDSFFKKLLGSLKIL